MARHILIFGALLALFLTLITRNVSPEPYSYDEADYMYAAKLGFAANWLDAPSISMRDFVRAGLRHEGASVLSERIRNANDVLFYRHFHGPLLHYLLIPISRLGISERGVRLCLLFIPAASLAVVYFGCLWIWAAQSWPAVLAGMLFLTSSAVLGSTEVAPHQLFALSSLASLVLVMKAIATGRQVYWYGSVVGAAMAFCTLEVGCVLVAAIAICGWMEWRSLLAKSAGAFIAAVLVLWPAAILRLSFVKSYAVMAYLATMREAAWGHAQFIDTWRVRFLGSPLEWALIGVALLFGVRKTRGFYPIALFAVLMIAATLRVLATTPRYSLTFGPELDLLAGLTLLPALRISQRPASLAVVALASAGLYTSACFQVARRPHNSNPRSTAVLTFIQQNALENKAMLVPRNDLPTLHYYFPAMRLRGYSGVPPPAAMGESLIAETKP
jgi:hypothetical protein